MPTFTWWTWQNNQDYTKSFLLILEVLLEIVTILGRQSNEKLCKGKLITLLHCCVYLQPMSFCFLTNSDHILHSHRNLWHIYHDQWIFKIHIHSLSFQNVKCSHCDFEVPHVIFCSSKWHYSIILLSHCFLLNLISNI